MSADLLAGTASGMAASLAGQPLDTVRVRLQARGQLYRNSWDVAVQTARADGVRGFFRGAVPPLLSMGPKNAIGFGAHGAALRLLENSPRGLPSSEVKRKAPMHNIAVSEWFTIPQ